MPIKKLLFWSGLITVFFAGSDIAGAQAVKTVRFSYFEPGPYYLHKVVSREFKKQLEIFKGDSLEIYFEPYGYRSAEWDREQCRAMARDLARLKDIDMVLAVGPWVVEDLLAAGFDRPIIAMHQFDPEAQGLVDRSGTPVAPNLTVNWRPNKINKDMAVLQRLFPSRRIGLLYFWSGDEFDRVKDKVARAAAAYGAEVIAPADTTRGGYFNHFSSYNKLLRKVNVLYLPPMWGVKLDQLRQFFSSAEYDRVPTLASEGILIVEKGAAAASCIRPYKSAARFTASKAIKIAFGARPSSLPTVLDEVESICVNPATLGKMGKTLSREVLKNVKLLPAPPADTTPHYTLGRALKQAVGESIALGAVGQRYEMTIAEVKRARASLYPHLHFELSAATSDNGRNATLFNPVLNRKYATEVIADQTLFSYKALKSVEVARKNLEIAARNREQAQRDLKHAVTVSYLAVLKAEDMVSVLEKNMDRFQEHWELSVANYRMGYGDTTDITFFEEQYINVTISLARAKHELRIARIILNMLLNRPNQVEMVLDRSEFSSETMVLMVRKFEEYIDREDLQRRLEEYLVNAGINNSTAMSVSSLSIDRQGSLIARNKGRYYPEVDLRARYSYGEEFDRLPGVPRGAWTIGARLRLPLLSGFDRSYEGRALRAELEELQYARDTLRLSQAQGIRNKLSNLLLHVNTLPLVFSSRRLSLSILESMFDKYSRQLLSAIDLIAAESDRTDREMAAINNMYGFYIAYCELMRAIGVEYMVHGSEEETAFYRDLEEYLGLR
ncbi:MAG: TolC family protein [Candidatus Zixiibacteriota bacterium]|nr:MAG: TolC family protein [candidate division Zixibacteria bacterium]